MRYSFRIGLLRIARAEEHSINKRTKLFLQGAFLLAAMSVAYLALSSMTAYFQHKPWSWETPVGGVLANVLGFLWVTHIGLFRPRTVRQRVVSWLFLFTVEYAWVAVRHVREWNPWDLSYAVFAAIPATVAVAIVWQYQRRKARASLETPVAIE